jgi:beta-lactamase class A
MKRWPWVCWFWLGTLSFAAGPGGMAEGVRDEALDRRVQAVVNAWTAKPRPKPLKPEEVAVTLIDVSDPARLRWGSHRGDQPIYPASVVKLFYLAAAHRWMEDGRLDESDELKRAMRDMIVDSYNEATHYVLDVLTGTTSGPELAPDTLRAWHDQRNAVNRYFTSLGYTGINCNKKPWCEGPYGREVQAIRTFEPKRNLLTTDASARLMTDIALDRVVTPARCEKMRALLTRDPAAAATPEDQVHGFIASGVPTGTKVWSKAGWTSQTRHDCALLHLPDGRKWVLVIFTEAHAPEEDLVPGIARDLISNP